MLLLLKLNFCSGSHVDHSNSASQLCKSFLKLLPVVVRCAVSNLDLDHGDSVSDCGSFSCSVDDCCVVLIDSHSLCSSKHCDICILKLHAKLFCDDLSTCKYSDILKHCLSSVAEARSLYSNYVQCASDSVENQCCKSFTIHILSDHYKWLAGLGNLLQERKKFLHVGDLLVIDENVWVVHDTGHGVPVVAEVG